MNGRSRDASGLEAGQQVFYRRHGKSEMYAGRIEWIDLQKPFPVGVMLDGGKSVVALCDEVTVRPPSPEWVETFLAGT